ncbi:iron-hydroxamate ABC transporter substrate-binding protein [Brevibacillus centrosporus]|uniref:Iron complex transport system substrate-binding protein n=1 Tax=Brevibacillus centrosporus TaxID=54910 RepID=A0A1I3LIW9_9BACL|nr:iron-hydroxamate ABC transporter substrate-binding protein [Brevibacillus centrosporus]MEC2131407.1 iron-hydroxamate ABC transporter substrate-binding protein [Brevibacillus centrosporus]RNB72567.1 iron-hydroxamate ABC transporter substrate-binding protein [Brevibacillus centrosporus]GED31162.1 ABC transporter substrate-binding protein [Brevibacillus centrosporus]SFI84395.1 iron complex transport system substrate-binding protein [Brevibacillus centrosporus]
MRKMLLPVLLILTMVLSACGKEAPAPQENAAAAGNETKTETKTGTVTYQSENGPIEIPADPKRIIGLTNAPNILSLDGKLVGVDQWTKKNPLFKDKLEDVETVSEEDLEKIIELKPDLIIAGSTLKNLDKMSKIAPTIVYTWGKLDYLAQQLEIGKVLNKEAEAKAWIDDFTKRAKETGEQIKAKIGEKATVSVFEYDAKSFYVFGNNWARGTEVLYQAMGLNMPDAVKKEALGPGYYMMSVEVIPQFAGDYIILSKPTGEENAFLKTDSWKNIPAVSQNHMIEIDTEASSYSDPTTLENLLKIFKEGFLGKA